MNKNELRQNIGTVVKLLPRPLFEGKAIADQRNNWLIVKEVNDGDALLFQNTLTNHEGVIPYESIRQHLQPDLIILRGQITLGKDGKFTFEPFVDVPEDEMPSEASAILPERLSHAETALKGCTDAEVMVLRELLIREKMMPNEIELFCARSGLGDGRKFFKS